MSSPLLERLRAQGERFPAQTAPVAREDTDSGLAAAQAVVAVGQVSTPCARTETDVVDTVRQILLRDHPELIGDAAGDGREQLRRCVMGIICESNLVLPRTTREALTDFVVREIAGYGPIDVLLAEADVTDIMVNGPNSIFVEQAGTLKRSGMRFRDEGHLRDTVTRMLVPLGKRVDNLSPFVDARLPDGSRLNVIIPPLATQSWVVTIRRFRQDPLSLATLCDAGTVTTEQSDLLAAMVKARTNMLIAGAAGTGKTTLLNALCTCIAPDRERLVTIEDSQELRLPGIHWVALEARPPNLEGLGQVTIRQLVRNALRMRPDRIVIGEVRDEAAFDFLQAINTGHSGSMCTIHANSAVDAVFRLENLVMTTGANLVLAAVRQYIVSALDVVLHLTRGANGERRLAQIGVVGLGMEEGRAQIFELDGPSSSAADVGLGALQARIRGRAGDVRAVEVVRLARRLLAAR